METQLSERTDEVLSFFDEGKEIECFGNIDELKEKVNYYLVHEVQRIKIAQGGMKRVYNSPYSYNDRFRTILEYYSEMKSL